MFFSTPGTAEGRWTLEEAGVAAIPLCSSGKVAMGHPNAYMPSSPPASLDIALTWAGGIYAWRPWVAALCDPLMSPPDCVIRCLCAIWRKPVGRGLLASV